MHNYTKMLTRDIAELSQNIDFLETNVDPKLGNIQISKMNKGHCSFCHCTKTDNRFVRKYLRKNETGLIQKLCVKEYYQKLLPALRQELAALEKFQKSYDFMKKYEVYRNLHPEKKKYVRPLFPTVETKIEDWKNKPERSLDHARRNRAGGDWAKAGGDWAKAGDDWAKAGDWAGTSGSRAKAGGDWAEPMFNTDFGMRLRSKSEYMIAMELHRRQTAGQLLFRYEQELSLADGGVVYPDFEIISLQTGNIYYYEHFGMMDDADYFDAFVRKMQRYARSGVLLGQSLIATYETSKKPLHLSQIKTALEIIA